MYTLSVEIIARLFLFGCMSGTVSFVICVAKLVWIGFLSIQSTSSAELSHFLRRFIRTFTLCIGASLFVFFCSYVPSLLSDTVQGAFHQVDGAMRFAFVLLFSSAFFVKVLASLSLHIYERVNALRSYNQAVAVSVTQVEEIVQTPSEQWKRIVQDIQSRY